MNKIAWQNERNNHLGPFKHQLDIKVVKNLINVKSVPYVKENEVILNISLYMCILFLDIVTVDHIQCIRHLRCLLTCCIYMFYQ